MNHPAYSITYEKSGITQRKSLITHDDYLSVLSPARKIIDTYKSEKELKTKSVTKEMFDEASRVMKGFPELWFTTQSPIYTAISTGVLSLLPTQGGDHKVSVKLVD